MKKTFLLFIAVMLTMVSYAQTERGEYFGGKVENIPNQPRIGTRSAETDEVMWSHTPTELTDGYLIGRDLTGEYSAAVFISGKGVTEGAKISSVAVPCAIEGMTNLKVWVRSSLDGPDLAKATVSSVTKDKYNKVKLDAEYAIPETGAYVGFTFNSSTTYPILFKGKDYEGCCWIKVPGEEWENLYDYGYGYGTVALHIYLTGKTFPQNSLDIELDAKSLIAKAGDKAEIKQTMTNCGSNEITSYKLMVDNGEKKSVYVLNLSNPIPACIGATFEIYDKFDIPTVISANNKVTFTLVEVNGQPNVCTDASAELKVKTAKEGGLRRSLVEEFTGTGCGYCPRGLAAMDKMKELYGDKFVGVALHQFNSGDPMFLSSDRYRFLGWSGAPSSMIDRALTLDPTNLYYRFDNYLSIPPLANVTVSGNWNEDGTAVEAYTDIESLTDGLNVEVAYVIVADGLTKKSNMWLQSNYYASTPADNFKDSWYYDKMVDYCSGGIYGSKYASDVVFNHVALSSSYVNGTVDGSHCYYGLGLGTKMSDSNTVVLKTSDEVMSVLDRSKVSIVAIVADEDGNIVNAAQAPVGEYSAGVEENLAEKAVADKIYRIDGCRSSKLSKGINIVRMSDGTVKKVAIN